ncbi:hypothetical protein CHS0354_015032 [Potamilus streckersoni]|uniref:EGF-like domain-containing protein n=1 Tax=Potamilus streckersoni TaxID=2493646 RepID=A0AAE0TGB5_9BIVA|nr:hypothetical protein CHS0354_015032 [Potamilus streckersoni]
MNKTLQIRSGTEIIRLDNRLMNFHNELEKKGVYVTAIEPVSIYVIESFNPRLDAAEGYLALPISALSTEYLVVTDNSANRTMSQFVIAALENNTTVTITFKTTEKVYIHGIRYPSESEFSLEMSTLDTFQLQHGQDLTGTFIQSNKPIAVFSGCKCGFGRPIGGSCQHEVEQIVPICALGQEYITVPLLPGYRYRLIAPFSNTVATIQGQNYTIEKGHFLERWETKPVYIHSSKPVFVMEYGESTYTNLSDPSMITLLPISSFSNNITFGLPKIITSIDILDYLFVVVEANRADNLMLNKQRLNLEGKYSVSTYSGTNYTIMVINITSGYHTLHHFDRSVRYGAVLYGTGQWTSIGFLLGYHKEIEECSNKNSCNSNAECNSTTSSYKCTCKNGFNGDGTTCTDIDECIYPNRCHVSAECHNTAGSYNCTCKNGFTGNGTTCADIDECNVPDICQVNAECHNTAGSYSCDCKSGLVGNGTTCADIDECDDIKRCDVNAECHNIFGSYYCTCKNGLTGNGTTCTDINECLDRQRCHDNAECHNTVGSYTCTCKDGFTGNGITCADVDECTGKASCDVNAECHNTFGSYTCNCKNGFTGSGTTCAVTGNMSIPVVRSEIQRSAIHGNQLVFFCDFDPSTDPLMLYQVTWYRDKLRAEYILTSSNNSLYSSREKFRSLTYLSEVIITLGMTVVSKEFFRLQDLEETLVHIRLTVPFGCQGQTIECFLDVNMFYMETEADQCLVPTAAALSNCGVRISSKKWNQSYPLKIAIKHGQNLISISRKYNIRFRTDEHFHQSFFRNYTLDKEIQKCR